MKTTINGIEDALPVDYELNGYDAIENNIREGYNEALADIKSILHQSKSKDTKE